MADKQGGGANSRGQRPDPRVDLGVADAMAAGGVLQGSLTGREDRVNSVGVL